MFRIHWKPIKSGCMWSFPKSSSRYRNKISNMALSILTADESWLYREDNQHSCWPTNPDEVPTSQATANEAKAPSDVSHRLFVDVRVAEHTDLAPE
jgi:hypothetical protein